MKTILFCQGNAPTPDTITTRIMNDALWSFYRERGKYPDIIISQRRGRYKLQDSHFNGQLYAHYEHTELPFPAQLATD